MGGEAFDERYYESVHLEGDRIALWWYARVLRAWRPRGGRLLEFGCGTGHLLKRLVGHFDACGFDVSAFARARSRQSAPTALVLDDWQTLPDSSLDVVASLHTLEHLTQPLAVVRQLAAKLVPGGILFFVVPNPDGLGRRLKGADWFAYRDPTHCSLLSCEQWLTLVREAGLRLRSVRGDGMWDPPYVGLVPTLAQKALFGLPAALQVFAPIARPFLPPVLGECLIVVAER